MKKVLLLAGLAALTGCVTSQQYDVPLRHYLDGDKVTARIETISELKKTCADEFILDRESGAVVGVMLGIAMSTATGGVPLFVMASSGVGGTVGHDVGAKNEPKNHGYERQCLPRGYEVRLSYYHPDNEQLVSHYVVMDKKVALSTVDIPMSWVPKNP